MKTMAKILGYAGLLLLGAVLAVFLTLIFMPELLVNKETLTLGIKTFTEPEQFAVDDLEVHVNSESWRKKLIRIYANNLCLDSESVEGCVKNLWLQVGVDLIGRPVLVYKLGPAAVVQGDLTFKTQEDPKAPWEETQSETQVKDLYATLESYIEHVKVEPIKVSSLKLSSQDLSGKITSATFDIESSYNQDDHLSLSAHVSDIRGHPVKDLTVEATFREWQENLSLPSASIDLAASLNSGPEVGLSLESTMKEKKLSLSLDGSYKRQGREATFKSHIIVSEDSYVASIGGEYPTPGAAINEIKIPACNLTGALSIPEGEVDASIGDCEVVIDRRRLELETKANGGLPTSLRFAMGGRVAVAQSGIDGAITADLKPFDTDLYTIDSSSVFRFDSAAKDADARADRYEISTKTKIELNRFEDLVKELNRAQLLVPAPLNSMGGKLTCVVEGKILVESGVAEVPHKCSIRLDGDQQRLYVNEKGALRVTFDERGIRPRVQSEIILSDIKMWLPDFSVIGGVPAFLPERRYTTEPLRRVEGGFPAEEKTAAQDSDAAGGEAMSIAYEIVIKTAGRPVRIVVPHYNTTIPFQTNLLVSNDAPVQGSLDIDAFKLKVVKRPIYVRRIDLDFEPTGVTTVDALATVEQTDYDVMVNVLGTLANPEITVTSDPPQAEEQLLSSLLYGQPAGELGADQRQSVAETQAAMTDGALGLLSFFYLASTPVERVGYNPQTGNVRASVKIRDRTSLIVGSDFETTSRAGFRRRLFGNWSLETVAVKESETGINKGVAVLRWAKRY